VLQDQNSRYTSAVGKANIGPKISQSELPSVQSFSRKNSSASASMFKKRNLDSANRASSSMVSARRSSMRGSMAGLDNASSATISMNGTGYSGARRKISKVPAIISSPKLSFPSMSVANPHKANPMQGRYSQNSKVKMSNILKLNKVN